MASAVIDRLLQCCSCGQNLNLDSHTLACLCNVCNTCIEESISTDAERQLNIRKCPKCKEVFYLEESDLLPFLATELKRRLPLECRSCSEENIVSHGKLWCQECKQIFCHSCNRVHMKLAKSHKCKDLDGVSRSEWIEHVMSEKCLDHGNECDFSCNQCNMYFCSVCCEGGQCPSCDFEYVGAFILNVKDEVVRQKTEEGPILEEEVKKFAMVVKDSNEKLMKRSCELKAEFDHKCLEVWQNYDEKVDCARRDADELCNKLRSEKNDEEVQLRDQLAGNASLLSQLEMWLLSCEHLLHEAERNVDILCGLHTLKQRVQSWQEKWNRSDEIMKIDTPTSGIERLSILSEEETLSSLDENQIPILNGLREINKLYFQEILQLRSIHVTEEDGHIFLCSSGNGLIELSENGEFLHEFFLKNEKEMFYQVLDPYYMCSISPDILVVCGEKEEIYFSERIKSCPFLKTKKNIKMTGKTFQSLCSNNDSVFVLDQNLTISCFNKNGEKIKTIKLQTMWSDSCDSMMRVDPVSENFWVSKCVNNCNKSYEIVCFNSKGAKISFRKTEVYVHDFYLNKFGHFFLLSTGIFYSFLPKKKKLVDCCLYYSKCFISENKIYVSDGSCMKVFQILYSDYQTL